MLTTILRRALPLAFVALSLTAPLAHADGPVSAAATLDPSMSVSMAPPSEPDGSVEHWTAYGFNIVAPSSMWPMLEVLHRLHFDWELYSAQTRPTPLVWANLGQGQYGQYVPSQNIVKVGLVLQNESVELGAAFLAHELTHLNDDLNGKLGDMTGDACYGAETRAFVNEANYWQMVNGAKGKSAPDALEAQENAKMFAFVGNASFVDVVLRTTASYVRQCGS